jgi:hypothetical protein
MQKALNEFWNHTKRKFRQSKELLVSKSTVEGSSKHLETFTEDIETLPKVAETNSAHVKSARSADTTTQRTTQRSSKVDGRSKERTAKQIAAYKRNFAKKKDKPKLHVRSSPVYYSIFNAD